MESNKKKTPFQNSALKKHNNTHVDLQKIENEHVGALLQGKSEQLSDGDVRTGVGEVQQSFNQVQ